MYMAVTRATSLPTARAKGTSRLMPTDRTQPGRASVALPPRSSRRTRTSTPPAVAPGTLAAAAPARWESWGWLRHWEFWLLMVVGVPMRLWNLGFSEMQGDQINYLTIASESLRRGAFPVTGLQFTIGVRSSPLDILLTMPFVVAGKDPLPDVIFIALLSVVGLVCCYIFAEREFGRLVAAIAALLFAVSGYAFDYSRFLWQLSYDPALLVLWGMSLYAGAMRGSRNWLIPNILLLGIMVSLHPTALLLLPVTVVALLLSPKAPGRRQYAWVAVIVALLVLPTIVWEVLSQGSDITGLLKFSSGHAVINADVFRMLYNVLGPPTTPYANFSVAYAATTPDAPYAWLNPLLPWLRRGINVLYPLGYLALTGLIVAPAWALLGTLRGEATPWRRARTVAVGIWDGLRSSARWRGLLLLWLWVTLPPLAMLRHSSPVHDHYLLIEYPAIFIMLGVAVEWTVSWLIPNFARGLSQSFGGVRASALQTVGTVALFGGVAIFIAGQFAECVLYLASVQEGKITTVGFYHPLEELQGADARLQQLQRQRNAAAVYVVNPFDYYPSSVTYLLVRDEPQRMSFAGACLVLPPPQGGSALVVSTSSTTPAATLLPELPNAQHIEDISMPGGEPFKVYDVQGNVPLLPGEHPVGPVTFTDSAGNGLRLDAAAMQAPGVLRLRWTVLDSTLTQALPQFYAMRASTVTSDNTAGRTLAQSSCEPTHWQAGQTVFTWLTTPTPPPAPGSPPSPPPAWYANQVALSVTDHTTDFWMSSLGPVRLLSGVRVNSPSRTLVPATGGTMPLTSSGELILPISQP
jgi:Dolichyl-phosphate-mannose-protein mannosyltransferase